MKRSDLPGHQQIKFFEVIAGRGEYNDACALLRYKMHPYYKVHSMNGVKTPFWLGLLLTNQFLGILDEKSFVIYATLVSYMYLHFYMPCCKLTLKMTIEGCQ